MASANTAGGVMGKMIDAQSIVVAAAATGEGGKAAQILRAVCSSTASPLALLVIAHRLALAPMPCPGSCGPADSHGMRRGKNIQDFSDRTEQGQNGNYPQMTTDR